MWILGILALGQLTGYFAGRVLGEKEDEDWAFDVMMTTVGALFTGIAAGAAGVDSFLLISIAAVGGAIGLLGVSRWLASTLSQEPARERATERAR